MTIPAARLLMVIEGKPIFIRRISAKGVTLKEILQVQSSGGRPLLPYPRANPILDFNDTWCFGVRHEDTDFSGIEPSQDVDFS